jgi:hypothetical protein
MPKFEWTRDNEPDILTPEEWDVYSLLSEAWNRFIQLSELHKEDTADFMRGINALKSIVMSRPVEKALQALDWPGYEPAGKSGSSAWQVVSDDETET